MSLVSSTQTDTAVAHWSGEQIEILKQDLGIKTDAHLAYFAQVCTHKNLDPFLNEIVPIYYGEEMVIQETVEGLRTIAERSGLYGGYRGPWYCGPDLEWHEGVWLDEEHPPTAAKYEVIRKDWEAPAPGYARWASCVQLNRYGKPRDLWKNRPDEMLAKTAEVRALRRAFSKEFARAGVNGRTLTDSQVVAVEGRRIGISDDERHAIVAEITGGRTESSTELTDDERLAARTEVVRRAAPVKATAAGPGGTETYWYDPATGERVDPPGRDAGDEGKEVNDSAAGDDGPGGGPEPDPTRPTTGTPAPAESGYVDSTGRVRVPQKDETEPISPEELERRRLVAELVPRARALEPEGRSLLHTWLDSAGIGSSKKVKDYTIDELTRTAEAIAEFEKPVDEEPF